jgi:hypothetical protein
MVRSLYNFIIYPFVSLEHIPPDEDGCYNGLVYPKTHNNLIWYLSWSSLPSGIYAITRGYYDLAVVPLGVFATSLMYWSHPDTKSWRRYIDISYVSCALLYQVTRVVGAEYMLHYYIITFIAVGCYPISHYYHYKHSWVSAGFHGAIHVLGTIANLILYSGYIPERWW